MVADSYFDKNFAEHGGLDYRSHDVDRLARFARECENVELLPNNSLTTRKGQNGIAGIGAGGGGLVCFSYEIDGERYEKLVTIDDNLHWLDSGSFTITYSGSADSTVFQVYADESAGEKDYFAKILEDGVEVFSLNLGNGIDETSLVDVGDLITAINALTDYGCSLTTGVDTGVAAFIGPYEEAIGASLVVPFKVWTQFFTPISDPFSAFKTRFTLDTFELASMIPHANRLFIASGQGQDLMKCDSVAVYKAGLPAATGLALGSSSGGGLTGDYYWQITYEMWDALGNYVEGDLSNEVSATLTADQQALTIPYIQSSTGYLTSVTQVNGDQTTDNILVDSSADFRVGMKVALYDRTTSDQFVEIRTVESIPDSTHITLDASVHVHNNDILSAGLVVNLWRNKAGGTVKYLVTSMPNDSASASISYTDNVADGSTGAEYEYPYEGHAEPPSGLKYLTVYQNLLIGSDGSEVIAFADPEGPEYWNLDFTLRSKSNDPVKGIGANRDMLLVQKQSESFMVVGDLPGGNYRQEKLSSSIGTDSHHSIVDVGGMLLSYSHTHGMRGFVGINDIKDMSYRVMPVFAAEPFDTSGSFAHKRALCVYAPRLQRVLLFLPKEDSNYHANRELSTVFSVDVSAIDSLEAHYDTEGRTIASFPKVKWFRWSGVDMSGGAAVYNDRLYFGLRHNNADSDSPEYCVAQYLEGFNENDYSDFGDEFDWIYESGWVHGGQPELLKKFLKAVIYSFPLFTASAFTLTAELETNFINGLVRSRKEITFGAASAGVGWGYFSWGLDPWGDSSTPLQRFPFKPVITTAVKPVFRSTVWLTNPIISAWTIETILAYRSKVKEVT